MPETPETLALAVDLRIDVFGPRMMTQSVADELSFRLLLEAAPLAERFGDPLRLARVEASLAGAYFGRTDYARQLEHARRSMAWAEQTGSVANVASVAYTLAMGHFQTARLDALLELCPRVMALIDAAGPRTAMFGAPYPPYITLANVLGFGYAALGRRRDAEVMLQRGEDVANEAAHPYAITLAHVVWSWALAYFGDGERCSSHGEAALAKAIALRSPGLEMLSRSAVGMGYLFSGEIDDARDAFELALKLSHAIGYQTFQTTSHWGLAQAHLADGAFDAAIASSRAGLAFSARTGERRLDPDFHRLIAEALALGSGAYAEAEREVRAGLALARTQQAIASMPRMRVVLGGLLVRRGASQEAQAELVRARDDALAIGLPAVLRQADSELRRLAQSP